MPYFPYSRQSKKKSHRGAITARMIANLLDVAGVNHVITIDLHASQMQGFFKCPVDNLVAEPLIAHWIKANIPDWRNAVVVSKNAGGTKRVTSLADALKLSFGIVMTDRRRPGSIPNSMNTSVVLERHLMGSFDGSGSYKEAGASKAPLEPGPPNGIAERTDAHPAGGNGRPLSMTNRHNGYHQPANPSPLSRYSHNEPPNYHLSRHEHATPVPVQQDYSSSDESDGGDDDDDQREPREVVTGRLCHGHVVDDGAPSPTTSQDSALAPSASNSGDSDALVEHMTRSHISVASSVKTVERAGLGGSGDAAESSDDEEQHLHDPESLVTLVGNVREKPVFIIDDMIDKPASWIAAAETVVKRGGALRVYCFATHGLFGDDCLDELEACDFIDGIVVTDAFPIPIEKQQKASKLRILDTSLLLSESIRRNHHGESMSQLFIHYN